MKIYFEQVQLIPTNFDLLNTKMDLKNFGWFAFPKYSNVTQIQRTHERLVLRWDESSFSNLERWRCGRLSGFDLSSEEHNRILREGNRYSVSKCFETVWTILITFATFVVKLCLVLRSRPWLPPCVMPMSHTSDARLWTRTRAGYPTSRVIRALLTWEAGWTAKMFPCRLLFQWSDVSLLIMSQTQGRQSMKIFGGSDSSFSALPPGLFPRELRRCQRWARRAVPTRIWVQWKLDTKENGVRQCLLTTAGRQCVTLRTICTRERRSDESSEQEESRVRKFLLKVKCHLFRKREPTEFFECDFRFQDKKVI